MKKLIFILLPFITQAQGSCGSPNGVMKVIASPPPNYAYLNDNGYCFAGIPTTANVTMCFTFVPTATSVQLNAGYSQSCANNNFTAFNLYNSSCALVSTSLTPSGLIIGQTYTWCVTMRAWGGFCNGYTTFCPYWIPVTPLGVTLESSDINCNELEWTTTNETNCDYYLLEGSYDFLEWQVVRSIKCKGQGTYTESIDNFNYNYYRVNQYDYDGVNEIITELSYKCFKQDKIKEVYDIRGRLIGFDLPTASGVYMVIYEDGTIKKIVK